MPGEPEFEPQNQPEESQSGRPVGPETAKQTVEQGAKQAVKQAVKAAAKAAASAAASFFMAFLPYILAAIFIIGLGVIIFLAATGALQGGFGGTPLQAATLTNQNHAQEIKELVNNLRLDLSISNEKYQEDVKKLEEAINKLEGDLQGQPSEVLQKYKELKDKATLLSNFTDVFSQKENITNSLNQIDNLLKDISNAIAKPSGGLVDFSDASKGGGVRLGAIGPGSRHPIDGRKYEVFRPQNAEDAEKVAREAARLVGQPRINGYERKNAPGQCKYLIKVVLDKAGLTQDQFRKIDGSPAYQRGDLVHFLNGNSPYGTGNPHWSIAI
ncbi:hypothetical protein HYU72_02360 [Candidatus Berkelbacteria bacterium]|nr:hypothetical protein [Candidatus Berkelbacteria bacterium]